VVTRFNVHVPPISKANSPLEFLKTFLTDDIIDGILTETNLFASQIIEVKPTAFRNFKDVTKDELWTFFALELLMGIVKKPTIKDYWTTDELLHSPMFPKAMSRNRFEEILRILHFSDNNMDHSAKSSRLWKLGTFLPALLQNFEDCITCDEYLCLDESLMAI
jgi:Transposase IS4